MNTGTILDAAAASDPTRTALIIDGRSISYGELAATVRQCAAALAARGVVAGDRVAVVDGGSLLSIATLLAAARIGAAAALMNPALTPPELRGLLKNAGCAEVGVAGEAYADRLRDAGATTVLTESDLAGDHRQRRRTDAADTADDRDALILFTSGTTGLPKAVSITSGQLTARIRGMAAPFRADAKPSVGMMCVPFFHVGGSLGVLGSLYSGNTSVVQTRFDAGEWLRLVSAASGDHDVLGADHAATDPRPSRLRRHRSDVSGRHRLRRRRRADRVGAPGNGRAPKCGVCQRVRPDRDARRLHDAAARRSPRSRPRGIRRPAATRSRSAGGGPRHRRRRRARDGRRVVGEHRPERHGRLAAHRRPGAARIPTATSSRAAGSATPSTAGERSSGRSRSRKRCAPIRRSPTSRSPGSPTRNWASGSGPRWWPAPR